MQGDGAVGAGSVPGVQVDVFEVFFGVGGFAEDASFEGVFVAAGGKFGGEFCLLPAVVSIYGLFLKLVEVCGSVGEAGFGVFVVGVFVAVFLGFFESCASFEDVTSQVLFAGFGGHVEHALSGLVVLEGYLELETVFVGEGAVCGFLVCFFEKLKVFFLRGVVDGFVVGEAAGAGFPVAHGGVSLG
ncbi:hypothetical protein HMPREF2605_04585 [Rothia sp. HMSC065C03]|nr:hypothetical protein HMPREF2605_04585 [Rothia sp. HMSC065C03]